MLTIDTSNYFLGCLHSLQAIKWGGGGGGEWGEEGGEFLSSLSSYYFIVQAHIEY